MFTNIYIYIEFIKLTSFSNHLTLRTNTFLNLIHSLISPLPRLYDATSSPENRSVLLQSERRERHRPVHHWSTHRINRVEPTAQDSVHAEEQRSTRVDECRNRAQSRSNSTDYRSLWCLCLNGKYVLIPVCNLWITLHKLFIII